METLAMIFGYLFLMVAGLISIFIPSLIRAWVLVKMWIWFLIPIFPMIKPIDYWQSFGLLLILGLVFSHESYKTKTKEEKERTKNDVWISIFTKSMTALLAYGIAYIFHTYIM